MGSRHSTTSGRFGLGVGFALAFLFVLSPGALHAQAVVLPTDPAPLIAMTQAGEKSFTIEVAEDPSERAVGLMFREAMDDDHGMLFIFPEQQPVGFWMKDTPLALDLIFIGQDGKVREIEQGEPLSEAPIASDEPVRFVLELKAGTAARSGIVEGTELHHPLIDGADGAANPN